MYYRYYAIIMYICSNVKAQFLLQSLQLDKQFNNLKDKQSQYAAAPIEPGSLCDATFRWDLALDLVGCNAARRWRRWRQSPIRLSYSQSSAHGRALSSSSSSSPSSQQQQRQQSSLSRFELLSMKVSNKT